MLSASTGADAEPDSLFIYYYYLMKMGNVGNCGHSDNATLWELVGIEPEFRYADIVLMSV